MNVEPRAAVVAELTGGAAVVPMGVVAVPTTTIVYVPWAKARAKGDSVHRQVSSFDREAACVHVLVQQVVQGDYLSKAQVVMAEASVSILTWNVTDHSVEGSLLVAAYSASFSQTPE